MTDDPRELFQTHFCTDFVKAGQDAFAMVPFIALYERIQTLSSNLQISAYPAPKTMIYVADAAAIKVWPLLFYVVHALDIGL
jgi:hypothetical protein